MKKVALEKKVAFTCFTGKNLLFFLLEENNFLLLQANVIIPVKKYEITHSLGIKLY